MIVWTEYENTEQVKIGKGVRQGSILSPYLFDLYSEIIMRDALKDLNIEVLIWGRGANSLKNADDREYVVIINCKWTKAIDPRVKKKESESDGLHMNIQRQN